MENQPSLTVAEVFAALAAGKARPMDGNDRTYFDAPAGSMILEADGGAWMYLLGSNFQIEAHGLGEDDEDVMFIASTSGLGVWERA